MKLNIVDKFALVTMASPSVPVLWIIFLTLLADPPDAPTPDPPKYYKSKCMNVRN